MAAQTPDDLLEEDYSPSSTLIPFAHPLPLLRQPIPASRPDNPSLGPYLLAFQNPNSFAAAYESALSQITQQCESGARIGCSIAATRHCQTPWWKTLIGPSESDFVKRSECEDREMEICFQDSRDKCLKFAKDKCFSGFKDARIRTNFPRALDKKNVVKFLSLASFGDKESKGFVFLRQQFGISYCRGSELLGDGDVEEVFK